MNNLLNTLLEEKEKLDKLYQMEEQHRKKIHENLDTLTIDQIKEMSLEDKILLRKTFLLSIDDMKMREALYIEIRRGLIKENGAAIHYPFLNELTFLTKEQIYEFDGFVARMRNLNALYKDLAETEFNNTSQEVAEYDNTEYKAMELTDDQWKQIIDMLVEHKVGKCMLKISACASGDTCWIDQTEYEKVRSGNASEEEKEELYDQIHENTCGYCEVSMCCEDLGYSNFMDEIKICGLIFRKDQKMVMRVDFGDGRVMEYQEEDYWPLTLAYAITVHKAQGSEYPMAILPMLPCFRWMLRRNIFYTAVTRARERFIIVGSKRAIAQAIRTDYISRRNTMFGYRIRKIYEAILEQEKSA